MVKKYAGVLYILVGHKCLDCISCLVYCFLGRVLVIVYVIFIIFYKFNDTF